MITIDDEPLRQRLRLDEGVRLKMYQDSEGHNTIGVGRNLDAKGINPDECDLMLSNDIGDALRDAQSFPWFPVLNHARQRVIVNMLFNMGLSRFKTFKKMIAAIERHEFTTASDEMLDSKWSTQVGPRARRLAAQMARGE